MASDSEKSKVVAEDVPGDTEQTVENKPTETKPTDVKAANDQPKADSQTASRN